MEQIEILVYMSCIMNVVSVTYHNFGAIFKIININMDTASDVLIRLAEYELNFTVFHILL